MAKMEQLAMTLDIAKFKNLCKRLSPDIAVMVRGKHGIGKSQVIVQTAELLRDDFYKNPENCKQMVEAMKNEPLVAKKLAKSGGVWTHEMGLPVIDRRLSQLTEGDMVGLPFMEKEGTEYKPVSFIRHSCRFPVALFLDELNRAIKQVEQSTFQLADSKAFYGNLLHAGTRIYIAVNIGNSYSVEEFDPAALSRYAIIDLEPSIEEFLDHVRPICNSFLPDFISSNRNALESKEDTFEPNKKTPDRRAWVRLDNELTYAGLYDTPEDISFLHMCAAMVGFHFGNMYWNHVKDNQFNISGKEIATNWINVRKRLPENPDIKQQKFVEMSNRLGKYLEDTKIDVTVSGPQIKQFLIDCPADCSVVVWALMSKNKPNFYQLHPYLSDIIVKRAGGSYSKEKEEEHTTTNNPIVPRHKR